MILSKIEQFLFADFFYNHRLNIDVRISVYDFYLVVIDEFILNNISKMN